MSSRSSPTVFDILLHEAVIGPPGDFVGADRGFLGARRDLVRVLIVQFELVDQRLLDLLVQQEIAIDGNLAAAKLEVGGRWRSM